MKCNCGPMKLQSRLSPRPTPSTSHSIKKKVTGYKWIVPIKDYVIEEYFGFMWVNYLFIILSLCLLLVFLLVLSVIVLVL